MGSFKSIKTFAELVLERFPRIDLLVNNGMYMLLTYCCTAWWSSRNVAVWEGMQVEALMFTSWTVYKVQYTVDKETDHLYVL